MGHPVLIFENFIVLFTSTFSILDIQKYQKPKIKWDRKNVGGFRFSLEILICKTQIFLILQYKWNKNVQINQWPNHTINMQILVEYTGASTKLFLSFYHGIHNLNDSFLAIFTSYTIDIYLKVTLALDLTEIEITQKSIHIFPFIQSPHTEQYPSHF